MPGYRAEFMIEPFVEDTLGPPVVAGIEAVTDRGFEPRIGAFGTTIEGEAAPIVIALADMLDAAMSAGATRVTVQVEHRDES